MLLRSGEPNRASGKADDACETLMDREAGGPLP